MASVSDVAGLDRAARQPTVEWASVITLPRSAVTDPALAVLPQVGDLVLVGHGSDARAVIIIDITQDTVVAVDVT